MLELVSRLAPLLAVDIVNPVLFALVLATLSGARPMANGLSLLAGHTFAYFIIGVVAALAIDSIIERLLHPYVEDYYISAAVGVLCLWAALKSRAGGASQERKTEEVLSPGKCFTVGAVVNFAGAPFAVPYFAAVDQVLRAELSVEATLATLVIYNLVYALPFALIPPLRLALGDSIMPALTRISDWLVTITDAAMAPALLLLGAGLLVDAVLYFSTGTGIF